MSCGIAETASELEKLKSESADLIEKAYRFGKDINVPNNDTISRQAAIDALGGNHGL